MPKLTYFDFEIGGLEICLWHTRLWNGVYQSVINVKYDIEFLGHSLLNEILRL
jgi:hypothetical protein